MEAFLLSFFRVALPDRYAVKPPFGAYPVRILSLVTMAFVLLSACGRLVETEPQGASGSIWARSNEVEAGAAWFRLDGAIVSGTLELSTTVEGARSPVDYRFLDSGQPLPVAFDLDGTASLDTGLLPEGEHAVVAYAPDAAAGANVMAVASFTVASQSPEEPQGPAPAPEPPSPPQPPGPPATSPPIPEGAVWIRLGQDAAAVVRAHPAGTTFAFEAGLHRLTATIVPREDDTFLGEAGAVLSGARLLTTFERENGMWVAKGQTQQGYIGAGECQPSFPRCRLPEELFIDDVRLRHVANLEDVAAGTWHFDYSADAIYLAIDPTGRRVETSVVEAAISGDADNVTVRGLVVEKFANPAQRGAIQSDRVAGTYTMGRNWTIENNVVRWNHGVGIRASDAALVKNNSVFANGQLGVTSEGGHDTVFESNQIAFNNQAGFDYGWEGGGSKFKYTTGLVVRGNHVHDNYGPGLWTDIDNLDTLYEYNVVERNQSTGIFHEISYRATVRYNEVRDNAQQIGADSYAYVFGAGILVYSSSNVEVYGNKVTGNWNGIAGLMHERGYGGHGRWELVGLHVHDNEVDLKYHADGTGPQGERGVWALNGVAQAGGHSFVFEPWAGNRFEGNSYRVSDVGAPYFTWLDGSRTFETWTKTYGQDQNATVEVGSFDHALAMN